MLLKAKTCHQLESRCVFPLILAYTHVIRKYAVRDGKRVLQSLYLCGVASCQLVIWQAGCEFFFENIKKSLDKIKKA
jgi:hypothetical protein